ncbi:MAG TPA: histidine kinase [Solirubrobacteraceae bacterium]|nr:histidine kinase [Solirubrobacteraceae bacterium]
MGTEGAVEHPRLLPGVLVPDPDAGRVRRTTRDWWVDLSVFAHVVVFAALFIANEHTSNGLDGALLVVDLLLGAALTAALWWRRRWPVALALIAAPVCAVSSAAGPAGVVLLFTVAVHRRWPVAFAVAALQYATLPIFMEIHPAQDDEPGWLIYVLVAFITGTALAWGMFVRARRQLVVSLRDRAERAEAEQQLRVEQARHAERARIAREMHDVLAHRISLLSLHAGALEFRSDASPEEVARAAGVIRSSAHQALEDLREVIGVLRDGAVASEHPERPERPQPTLADLPCVLDESREAGMKLDAAIDVVDLSRVPASPGRTALRIVQEGLTNARKHAPGAAVTVRVSGAAGDGLEVEVRNRSSVLVGAGVAAAASGIPGAGTGLVGLVERATLAGGRLEHGVEPSGDFRLRAWLPWPA